MNVSVTLKNYRCFPDSYPARLLLSNGFTGLIGVNNSGKSSLLKFFYEFRGLFQILSNQNIRSIVDALRSSPQAITKAASVRDLNELFSKENARDLSIALEFDSGSSIAATLIITVRRGTLDWTARLNIGGTLLASEALAAEGETPILLSRGRQIADLTSLVSSCRDLYQSMYIGSFRNAINIGGTNEYFDIRIGQQFIEAWRAYKTGPTIANNESAYGLIQDVKRIFGYSDLDINASADNQTLQLFVNGKSFTLSELGGGVSQFIVVLANAMVRRPALILIDEPEMNLHPSLQLDFLTTLGSYATAGVMFSTHSIGLARASADRVYALRRLEEGRSELRLYESMPRLAEFLGELSFSGFQELGFSRVLLVEGPTDVRAVQQFLRLYKKGHEVVLLPLCGASLINEKFREQLEEIKRITPNISALIDSERSVQGQAIAADRAAFVEACKDAGIRCHVLDRRATENYFPDRAVKVVKGASFTALTPFQHLKTSPNGWAKDENWRIAGAMSRAELDSTDLGQFLESL
jgi:ABC-type cobalamin/Fe3+-siderophores transport system ATPase subunit